MSDSETIATPPHEPGTLQGDRVHDEEDRLRPEFVREVLDAVADGDDETARALVADLHPADIADLIELAPGDERADLIEALAGIVDADVYAELNEHVREDMIDEMEPQQVADLAAQLDTDDAVA
jgi:magnesium transporter